MLPCETMQIFERALLPLKSPMSRSCTSYSAFWLSHIASYAPSPARPNMRHICDPCFNFFCGMESKSIKYNYNYDTPYFDKQPGIPTWNTRKKENYKIYTFSEKGEWSNPPGLTNRQNGYITSFNNGVKNSNDSFWERYVIEWANGLISTITVSRSDDGESSYQFKYNENSVQTGFTAYEYEEGCNFVETMEETILTKDSYGNWVSIQYSGTTKSECIGEEKSQNNSYSCIITREITYHDKSTLPSK